MVKKKVLCVVSALLALLLAVNIVLLVCMSSPTVQVKIQLELAQRYLEDMEYEEAIAAFKKAIAIDPKIEEAYIGLADVYIALEDYEAALSIIEQGYEETQERSLSRKMEKVQEMLPQEANAEAVETQGAEEEAHNVSETEETSTTELEEEFVLTEEGKDFLSVMCRYLPLFSDADDMDDRFWWDFLWYSYTEGGPGRWGGNTEYVAENEEHAGMIKVSEGDVQDYVRLALGVDLPKIDLYSEYNLDIFEDYYYYHIYYENGFYYFAGSDGPLEYYEYQDMIPLGNNQYKIIYSCYSCDGEEEYLGYADFVVETAENQNGFIVISHENR